MEADMKDLKVMVWEMVKANFFINKVVSMMENGKIIICMGMVNYIIQIIN